MHNKIELNRPGLPTLHIDICFSESLNEYRYCEDQIINIRSWLSLTSLINMLLNLKYEDTILPLTAIKVMSSTEGYKQTNNIDLVHDILKVGIMNYTGIKPVDPHFHAKTQELFLKSLSYAIGRFKANHSDSRVFVENELITYLNNCHFSDYLPAKLDNWKRFN